MSAKTWVLAGVGLGLVNQKIGGIAVEGSGIKGTDLSLESYTTFALDAQIGGITMWNRYFGLQYYYNLNLNIDTSLKNKEIAKILYYKIQANVSGVIATSTFNLDAVINAYRSDFFGVGITAGFGIGFDISKYQGTFRGITNRVSAFRYWDYNPPATISFDARFNVGLRFIFGKNFALSLNCSVPFLAQAIDLGTSHYDRVSFSTRFVYGRF